MCLVAYEDFKYRGVSWFFFPIIFFLNIIGYYTGLINWRPLDILISILFLFVSFLFVYLYFRWKNGREIIFINQIIGAGDILFLCLSTMVFDFSFFFFFYFLSLFAGILFWGIMFLGKKVNITIPLAGIQAIILSIVFFAHYNNFFILDVILTLIR